MEVQTKLELYTKQQEEWRAIRDELIFAGTNPSASDVSLEQERRATARGQILVTYEEVVAEHKSRENPH